MKPGHIVRFCKRLRRAGYPKGKFRVYSSFEERLLIKECNGSRIYDALPEHLIIVGGVR